MSAGLANQTHTVRPGDTMGAIAADNNITLDQLSAANPQVRDVNRISVGQELNIPSPPGSVADTSAATSGAAAGTEAGANTGTPAAGGAVGAGIAAAAAEADAPAAPATYSVRPGDTMGGIAADHNVTFGQLTAANPQISDPNRISVGQQVNIPDGATAPEARPPVAGGQVGGLPLPDHIPNLAVYPPNSDEAKALFAEAARVAGVPESWANSPGLHNILSRESGGVVGRPNYTYGSRANDESQWPAIHQELKDGNITARSSATGLGQLLSRNAEVYYPSGKEGIGNPLEEAAGMLSYIKDRYGNPDQAWAEYGVHHEGY